MIAALKRREDRAYSMERVYQMLGTSRQAIAQQGNRQDRLLSQEADVLSKVRDWRKHHPKMGSGAMYYSMVEKGILFGVGVNKFEQIVSRHGLGAGIAQRTGPYTSDGKGRCCYLNLTNGLVIKGINRLLVGDITYFDIEGKWHYIFTLKDVYSQYIVGLRAANTMQGEHVLATLKSCEPLRGSQALKGCIHHSDNGSQYNSISYIKRLNDLKMKISRAEGCQQNGSAEQLNHIVKNMYFNYWSISSLHELQQACKEFQYLNNYERAIEQLGHKTPSAFEQYINSLAAQDRPAKRLYDFSK